jgi:CDP-diacylglycerol--glycerol-3-phosphate 3-phosphatidyltransferase
MSFYFDDIIMARRVSGFLFLIASITDFLDGYIARRYNFESNFGKILDPIADKILVGSTLIMLVKFNNAPEIPCVLILAREFMISGVREFVATRKIKLSVSKIAKVKTFFQMAAIFTILVGTKGSGISFCDELGNFLLWVAALLTVSTSISYLRIISKNL